MIGISTRTKIFLLTILIFYKFTVIACALSGIVPVLPETQVRILIKPIILGILSGLGLVFFVMTPLEWINDRYLRITSTRMNYSYFVLASLVFLFALVLSAGYIESVLTKDVPDVFYYFRWEQGLWIYVFSSGSTTILIALLFAFSSRHTDAQRPRRIAALFEQDRTAKALLKLSVFALALTLFSVGMAYLPVHLEARGYTKAAFSILVDFYGQGRVGVSTIVGYLFVLLLLVIVWKLLGRINLEWLRDTTRLGVAAILLTPGIFVNPHGATPSTLPAVVCLARMLLFFPDPDLFPLFSTGRFVIWPMWLILWPVSATWYVGILALLVRRLGDGVRLERGERNRL
jgi:hypothetical protein